MAMQNVFLAFSALLILLFAPLTESLSKPSSVFLPVHRDNATGLYLVDIPRKAPLKPVSLLIDLNSKFLSADCDVRHSYLTSAYHYPLCNSNACSLTGGDRFCRNCSSGSSTYKSVGCHNNTCFVLLINPLTNKTELADVTQDVLAVRPLQGSIPGPLSIIHDFIFTCAPSAFFRRFPQNVRGFAGFSKDPVSLPSQITSRFGYAPGFSLCLSSRKNQDGGIFFGKSPYQTTPQKHIPNGLMYTPFLVGSRRGEYLLPPVKTIKISQKPVKFNASHFLNTPDQNDSWVTMISSTVPYTQLHSVIFRALTKGFVKEFSDMGASVATPVAPFGACFSKFPPPANEIRFAAPVIDLMMQTKSQTVSWRVLGSNSLVEARKGKWCLAFVDGGISPRAIVVLGAYQLQDHVLEFDFNRSRLGFSQTSGCPQFN